jgi:hypothetical protein
MLHYLLKTSRPAMGRTQPPNPWVPDDLSSWIQRRRREADHSPPSSAGVKNVWKYTFTPHNVSELNKSVLYNIFFLKGQQCVIDYRFC